MDKLKDLCLKQREEIKSLKSAILFPDVMNSQLQELLEKQGSELKQAKQVIPNLQRQVTSLTGQLQCLAVDLAEVLLLNFLYLILVCPDAFIILEDLFQLNCIYMVMFSLLDVTSFKTRMFMRGL